MNGFPSYGTKRRRTAEAEPRMRVERTTVLADMLCTMPRDRATALLARVLYEAPIPLIAEQLHITAESAQHLVEQGIASMQHPSRARILKSVFFDDEDDTLLIDGDMRGLIRQWRLEELFAPRCEQCELPYSARAAPVHALWSGVARNWLGRRGRPRRYCSDACRQKAYRARCKADLAVDHSLRAPNGLPEQ
ncbi:hypothetical protein R6V09_00210 [Streptomyces sp. W16]|uniref:hypothetical protein n=1 Tax=Streptomyces sp. W16 TaxID=3076631 RepID=UPI00295A85FB|nr:hypothetical protein [Streptomyces sp. W16]MDV9168570.1 hypothetical protein [Streptomyces sp. W16]